MMAWPLAACASHDCAAPIIWAVTEKGRRMPIDAAASADGSIQLRDRGGPVPIAVVLPIAERFGHTDLHTSHFATCAHSAQWRRSK